MTPKQVSTSRISKYKSSPSLVSSPPASSSPHPLSRMRSLCFTLEHFIPKKESDFAYHYFYFLVRSFFNRENFPGGFYKTEFFRKGQASGFSPASIKRIWHSGATEENPFIDIQHHSTKPTLYRIRSHKHLQEKRMVRICSKEIIDSIRTLPDFKHFCYALVASRPFKLDRERATKIRKYHTEDAYAGFVGGRTLDTVGKLFGKTKSAMGKCLIQAKKKFIFFNITARYITIHSNIARISNIYSLRGVEYYFQNKEVSTSEKSAIKMENSIPIHETISIHQKKDARTVPIRILRKKKLIFGKKIENASRQQIGKEIFLERGLYSDVYRNIVGVGGGE